MDEVVGVLNELGAVTDRLTETADAIFDALDANQDGKISGEEYAHVVVGWMGPGTPHDDAFHLLDLDGDGFISRREFAQNWHGFWTGYDETSPSQYVFGPL